MNRALKLWFFIFLLMSAINWHTGGPNASSRFAAIEAMAERHRFDLGPLEARTIDWARTPDGRVFSNKAPGPMFLALPVEWVVNRVKERLFGDAVRVRYPDGEVLLSEPSLAYKTFISWLFQIFPYCLLVLFCVKWLQRGGASFGAMNFAVIALLFGNTLCFMLDAYYGHAVAACSLLAMLLFFSTSNFLAIGFCFGMAVLSDYGTIFLLPPFIAMTLLWVSKKGHENWKSVAGRIFLGGAFPLALWVWYHTACFGKPWALPMKFQNPEFVDLSAARPKLWGVANFFPDWRIFLKLCFGRRRGILFTQPWMWIVSASTGWLWVRGKLASEIRAYAVFCVGGLFCLLWMNAGFNGWHGGGAPGPRYLSIIFPAIALLAGAIYDQVPRRVRRLLWLTLGIAVVLRILGYAGESFAPKDIQVWSFVIDSLIHNRLLYRGVLTAVTIGGYFLWAGVLIYRRRDAEAMDSNQIKTRP